MPGNTKLARRPSEGEKPLVLIESRGEGGYILAAPTPGYGMLDGSSFGSLPVPSADERAVLIRCARELDELGAPEGVGSESHGWADPASGVRPGDDFDRRGDVRAILERHGWQPVRIGGDFERWRRPGKTHGDSATLQLSPPRLFRCWSDKASPFEREKSYTPFAVYALLEHGGEFRAAARSLAREGYGGPSEERGAGGSVESVESVIREEDWEEPVTLRPGLPELPDFPIAALPRVMRDYVLAEAEQAQVPVEMVASFVLATTSLAICRRFEIEPWPGWREPANLWTACTAAPGTRKSTVEGATTEPVYELERELAEEQGPDIARAAARRRIIKKQLDAAEKKASGDRSPANVKEAERLAVEYEQASIPPRPRLVTTNATNEAVGRLLSESDGRLLVSSSEGGEIMAVAGGLYTKGRDNYDNLLKGWSGDTISIDRKGSERAFVKRPAVAIAVMFQPSVLEDIGAHRSFRGRGLLARFLFVIPKVVIGFRKARGNPMSDSVRLGYHDMIGNLLRLPDIRDVDKDGNPVGDITPRTLCFSDEAGSDLVSFFDEMEIAQREFGPLEGMQDWASKAHGQAARIAAVLHMARHHADRAPWEVEVSAEAARAAIDLTRYFLEHAKAAFRLMGESIDAARAVKLIRYCAAEGILETTKRDLHRAFPTLFERADELDAPLRILEERGYIRVVQEERRGPGRRPSPKVIVNPKALRQFRQIRQKPPPRPPNVGSVKSVNSVNGGPDQNELPPDHGKVRF